MREEYIKMRNKQQYNINWFYKYFISQGGNLDGQTFGVMFNQFGNLNDVIAFLDSKFNLSRLFHRALNIRFRTFTKTLAI